MGVLPDWMIERDVKIVPFSPQENRPGIISFGNSSYGYDVRSGYKWKVFDPLGGVGPVDPKNFDPELLREIDLTPHNGTHEFIDDGNDPKCGQCKWCDVDVGRMMLNECSRRPQLANFIVIPPNSYALGESFETFTIPRDVVCICVGKSTYARCGIIVNVTPGEPEWTGKWTIEISNSTPLPAKVYCGEGIMQCVFIRSDGYREQLHKACQSDYGIASSLAYDSQVRRKEYTCRVSYADKKGKYQSQGGVTHTLVK